MKEDNATIKGCSGLVVAVVAGLLICFIISLCSCKAQREIQIERVEVPVVVNQEHSVESVKIDHVRDTVIQRDSVYHYIKGDTTIIERWHYLQSTGQLIRVDTLIRVDSVQVPVEVVREKLVTEVKEVPRPFSWWQKTLMIIGGSAMIAILLLITYKIRKR